MRSNRKIEVPVPLLFCPLCVADHEAEYVAVDPRTGGVTYVIVSCGHTTFAGEPGRLEERDSYARGMYRSMKSEKPGGGA